MSKTVMLIDGSSLIFRAFFALPNLTNNDGVMTNGVYGFLTMYFNAFEKYKPDYVLVAFDRPSKTFRHKEFEDYKATRDKMPSELSYQFGILKDILDSLNVKYTDLDGFEADDIVGTYAKMAQDKGYESVLITGDRDYLQLVDDKIVVFLTKKGVSQTEEYTVDKIKEEFGINPSQLIDVKGLEGDKSDNIPGIDGIGPKKAQGFIREYGSIENLYKHIDEISGKKTKQSLIDNENIAYMSKKIGTIVTHAPVEYDLEDLKYMDPDDQSLREKYNKYNFNKFLEDMADTKSKDSKPSFTYSDSKNKNKLIKSIKEEKELYFYSVFDGENYIHSNMAKVAIKTAETDTFIFDPNDEFVDNFKNIFEDSNIIKIGFDIKKEILLFNKLNIKISDKFDDLMLANYLIDPQRSSYDIKNLSQAFLTYDIESEEALLGKGKKKSSYLDIKADKLNTYLASLLNVIEDSKKPLFEKLESYKMKGLYQGVEINLCKVLANMEISGFATDKKVLEDIGKDIDEKIDTLTKDIYELAGSQFNINSTKQLGEVLFKDLNLPVIKKTKTGYSTDQSVLEKLRNEHQIIPKLEKYRELFKLRSTYINGLIDSIDDDSRIRSTFMQNIAATGRLSSKDPNLQNLPIKTDEGRLIRKAFKASEGNVLIDADYSQIELRILASLSDDENMKKAFIDGVDIHTKTASEVLNKDVSQVSKRERSEAKAVNFGIIYGISDYGLSQNLNIPRKAAKKYIDGYLKSYPKIKKYMDDIVKKAKEDGYVETIYKRRRYIPEINSKNFNVRNFGQRIALNTPIQGSAADIIKLAMIETYKRLEEENIDGKIILQIHDEIILEVSQKDKQKARDILKESMEKVSNLDVPLLVDIDFGDSLYESK